MVELTSSEARKALVALAIEKTLLDIGKTAYDKVGNMLYSRYQVYFPDCYEHPEFLNTILKELYGKSFTMIVESIRKELGEIASQEPVKEFLIKISE